MQSEITLAPKRSCHCKSWKIKKFTVRLCFLDMPQVILMKSYQQDFLNMIWSRLQWFERKWTP